MSDSKKIDDGGSAFPVPEENFLSNGTYSNAGMTLRDWFAGQAISGMLASDGNDGTFWKPVGLSVSAYEVADAMIAARSRS